MSNERQQSQEVSKEPFILDELRPNIKYDLDEYPPLEPNTSREEMQKRIRGIIGEPQMVKLGLAEAHLPPEIWKVAFTRSPDVEWTELDGEAVVVNLENGIYYTLNRVSTVIWELLTGEHSLESILDRICEQFDVTGNVACDDLMVLVTKLRQDRLILAKEKMHNCVHDMIEQTNIPKQALAATQVPIEIWKKLFKISPEIEWTVLNGEAVVLNLKTGNYYSLNQVSTVIWEYLTGDQPLETILYAICERFDVTEDVACKDMMLLITELRQEKLILEEEQGR